MIKLLVTTCLFYSSTVTGYDCDTESWPPEEIALEWQAYCRLSGNSAFAITEDCTYAQYRNATSTHLAEYEAGSVCDSQNPTSGCFIYDSDGSRCHGTLRAVSSGSNAALSRRTELWAGILSAAIVILLGFYVFTCHGHKIEDVEVFHDDILEIQDDLKPKGKSADVEITELDNRDLPSESGGTNLDSIWDEVKEKPKLPTPIRVYIADDEGISATKQVHTPRTLSPLPRERVPSPQGLKVIIPKVQDSPRNFSEPQFALQKFNTLEASPGDSYRVFVNPASGSSFNLIPAKKHNEYESSRSSFRDHSPYAKRSMSPRCRMISSYISRMKSATDGLPCRPRAESELTLTQAWSLSNAERNRRAHAINGNSVSRSREAHHRKGGGAKPIVTQNRRKTDRRVKSKDISNWNNALQSLMTTRFDTLAVDIEERLQAAQKETSLQLKKMEADFRRQFGEESLPRTKKKSTTPPMSKPLYIVSPSSFEFPPTTPYAISPHAPILSPRSPSYVHPDYVPVTSTPPDRPPSKRGPLTLFDKEHLTFDSNDYFRPVVPEEPEQPLIKEKRSRILDIKSPSSNQLTSDEPHSDSSIISDSKENLTKSEKRLLKMFFDIFANEMGVLDISGVQEWVKAVHLTWEDDACREDAMERVMLNGKDGVITRKGYLDYYREMKPARPHKFQKEMTNLKSWNINESPSRKSWTSQKEGLNSRSSNGWAIGRTGTVRITKIHKVKNCNSFDQLCYYEILRNLKERWKKIYPSSSVIYSNDFSSFSHGTALC